MISKEDSHKKKVRACVCDNSNKHLPHMAYMPIDLLANRLGPVRFKPIPHFVHSNWKECSRPNRNDFTFQHQRSSNPWISDSSFHMSVQLSAKRTLLFRSLFNSFTHYYMECIESFKYPPPKKINKLITSEHKEKRKETSTANMLSWFTFRLRN